jgi:hypothetical protein
VTIREFWSRAYTLPRAAIVCAAIAALLNALSYFGFTMNWAGGLGAIHVAIMLLGLAALVRAGYERMRSAFRRKVRPDPDPLPKGLIWLTVASLAYLVALIIMLAAVYGEGFAEVRDGREVWVVGNSVVRTLPPGSVAEHNARSLRIFSASWLFFGLLMALLSHRVEERIHGVRAPAPQSSG